MKRSKTRHEVFHSMTDVFIIFTEPVITEGSEEYSILSDGWTIVSKDNSRSCQFEHTLLITNTGVEILTTFYTNYESI